MAWHDATCATLDLEWEDGEPGCRKCERRAPRLAPVHPISPPAPPPDTPRSKLVCTWPPGLFSQPQSGDDEDSELLARLLANIDEWAGTTSVRPLQTALQSDQQSPLQQPPSQSGPDPLFRGIYSRLPNADSIRLLRLHGSADTSDPICGTLEIHRLRDPCRPIFEAFSYTWADSKGDSSLCKTIFLGPQYDVLPVTTNCLAALRRFRTPIDRLVWVDAICINQFDLRERGHQVSLMRDIYTSAARVLVYLGDSNHGAGNAMALPLEDDRLPGESTQSPDVNFNAILRTPYFSRIWVIQEVMLSKTASVTFGHHTMHLEDLLSKFNTSIFNTSIPTKRAELAGNWLKHVGQKRGAQDLFSLLLATQNCHCGDLRDRVYGLMGLVTEQEREQLPVDYNISVQQLYTGLAAYWLTSSGGQARPAPWEILYLALLPKITPFLPSWAPDWAPQSRRVVSRARVPSKYLTIQFDTTHIQRSSGMAWSSSFESTPRGWMLDEISWELSTKSRNLKSNENSFPWHESARRAGWRSEVRAKLLAGSSALALDAVHILSTSMGKVELTDRHGKLLHGLQTIDPIVSSLEESSPREQDIQLQFLPGWDAAVATKKQSNTVFNLHGLSRIVSAPLHAPVPPSSFSISDIIEGMEMLEFEIVEHWMLNSFVHGVCAGSAYVHTRIQTRWFKHFPLASSVCQAWDFPFDTVDEKNYRSSITAAMKDLRKEVLHSLATPSPWSRLPVRIEYSITPLPTGFGELHYPYVTDAKLAARIEDAQAIRQPGVSSPQEMLEYLRNVVKVHHDSCRRYVPLEEALSDLGDKLLRPFMWAPLSVDSSFSNLLLFDGKGPVSRWTKLLSSPQEFPITHAYVMWRARGLLSDLKIDSGFSLEQNFHILWIHVLTFEMVARLRGMLQQRLILQAIGDKMGKVQEIHII